MSNFETFTKGLQRDYRLENVIDPMWMRRTNNGRSIPLIRNFRGELPAFIDVPEDQARTKLLEYRKTPMLCRKCQEYGHN